MTIHVDPLQHLVGEEHGISNRSQSLLHIFPQTKIAFVKIVSLAAKTVISRGQKIFSLMLPSGFCRVARKCHTFSPLLSFFKRCTIIRCASHCFPIKKAERQIYAHDNSTLN